MMASQFVGKRAILTLKDGRTVEGKMVADNTEGVLLELDNGTKETVIWMDVAKSEYPDTSVNDILGAWSNLGSGRRGRR